GSRHDYEQELAALHTYVVPTEAGYFRQKPTQSSAKQTKSSYRMPKTKRGPEVRSELVVGIDLGTTNSAVARFAGRRPVIIKQEGGASTVPSVVGYLPDGQILIGQEAQRHAAADAFNTFYSVKRFIGRHFDDLPKGAIQQ
ncbi:MAG: molecular chaperone, partial [Trebouxia sp. A1-2]